MKSLALLLVVLPALAFADKSFTGGKGTTWDCKTDPTVNIDQGNGNYVFKGACKAIHVNGGHNTLVVESVDELAVNGSDNTITVNSVTAFTVNGSKNKLTWKTSKVGNAPQQTVLGKDNQIQQAK